jgi:hypothetical protein
MVHVLQKLQKDGAAHDPVRRQAAVPRGDRVPSFYSRLYKKVLMLCDFTRPQMMAMNVVPRLILADAS